MTASAVSYRFLTPRPPLLKTAQLETKSRFHASCPPLSSTHNSRPCIPLKCSFRVASCLSSSSSPSSPPKTGFNPSTRLYVSGLSFRTTEKGLRDAFKHLGDLVEVNLVMDRVANRSRGFAFLSYATEEESEKAIEEMHGKFLDGRVIFVEVAKSRAKYRNLS